MQTATATWLCPNRKAAVVNSTLTAADTEALYRAAAVSGAALGPSRTGRYSV